jgi:hypothetical protein
MKVEIGAEAALFPEKEYINGIAVAVRMCSLVQYTYNNSLSRQVSCSLILDEEPPY